MVIAVTLVVAGAYFSGFLNFGGSPNLTMPSNMKVLAQDENLKKKMMVNATAGPPTGTEIKKGDSISCSVNVEKLGTWPDKGITLLFIASRNGSDLKVSLLVGKGNKVNGSAYVNSMGGNWRMVGSDAKTLTDLENSKTFNLAVTY